MTWKQQFVIVLALILLVMVIFAIPFFVTSWVYQAVGQQPSALVSYLANILLGCVFSLLIVVVWAQVFKSREQGAYMGLFNPILDGMEKISRGDFNISVEDNMQENVIVSELVKSVNRTALELHQMELLRQEFISNVSHEIQSPLTSIRGFAQALQNARLSAEDRSHYLVIIETETRRLSRLTENLLKLASLDAKQVKFEPKSYRLDKQIRNLILACEPQWVAKALDMDVSVAEVTITADEDLLSQVWLNLIYNSIKFTPQGGRIAITLLRQGDAIQFQIRDTGIGISDADQTRIFERFYKADRSRTRTDSSGSGLGLAIVRKIVEMHNGTIVVKSAPGAGTTFTVSLPV
jgi:two-component system, OmpR family, phosphate regulon sensor histidine kinase PhoR